MCYKSINPASAFSTDTSKTTSVSQVTIACSGQTINQVWQNKWVNRRLADQEMILVAVKVINRDTMPYLFSYENLEFFNDYTPAPVIASKECYKKIRQKYWPNLLYIPITLATSYSTNETSSSDGGSIVHSGFRINFLSGAIGAWGVINSSRTYFTNRKIARDLKRFNLDNTTIPPQSEVYGLVVLKATYIRNPIVRIKNRTISKHPKS